MDAIVARASSTETSERDHGQAENLDMKRFARRPDRLEIRPVVVAKTKIEVASGDGLLHRVRVPVELVADRRPDEVRAIGIEALVDQQVDMARDRRIPD